MYHPSILAPKLTKIRNKPACKTSNEYPINPNKDRRKIYVDPPDPMKPKCPQC